MSNTSFTMFISFITNVFLSITKVVMGVIGNSMALIADGFQTFSDLSTDLMAILTDSKENDKNYPYEHSKRENVANLIVSLAIIFLGLFIIYKSQFKSILIPNILLIVISLFTIIDKFLIVKYLKKKSIKYNDEMIGINAKESRLDAISSIVVLVSIVLMNLSNNYEPLKYSDIIATIIVGIFIVISGFKVLEDSLTGLLGKVEVDLDYQTKLDKEVAKDKDVIRVNNSKIVKYGPYLLINIEISLDEDISLIEAESISKRVENRIKKYDKRIKYVIVHIEPLKLIDK